MEVTLVPHYQAYMCRVTLAQVVNLCGSPFVHLVECRNHKGMDKWFVHGQSTFHMFITVTLGSAGLTLGPSLWLFYDPCYSWGIWGSTVSPLWPKVIWLQKVALESSAAPYIWPDDCPVVASSETYWDWDRRWVQLHSALSTLVTDPWPHYKALRAHPPHLVFPSVVGRGLPDNVLLANFLYSTGLAF